MNKHFPQYSMSRTRSRWIKGTFASLLTAAVLTTTITSASVQTEVSSPAVVPPVEQAEKVTSPAAPKAAQPRATESEATQSMAAAAASAKVKAAAKKRRKMTAFVTGYTYYDNTPAGTANISHPVVHRKAGGAGTYNNPITVAVGHRYVKGRDVLQYPKGTRLYMYYLDRYFIVEDTCGDGPRPERGACYRYPKGTSAWFDIWIGGAGVGARTSTRCAESITGRHTVLVNPPRGHKISKGAISRKGRCAG